MIKSWQANLILVAVLVVTMGSAGCATKKFVFSKLNPLKGRVDKLETETKETSLDVAELQTGLSRTDERAITADQKADEATQMAVNAGELAKQASRSAAEANMIANNSHERLDEFGHRIDSLDNLELLSTDTVLFAFASRRLDKEAELRLDGAVARIPDGESYVIEVQGFTDTSGDPEYNLALSSRRAEAVVRYLTTQHRLPLRRIHVLGMGSALPAADNESLEGRKLNRRVEVKLYSRQQTAAASQAK